MYVLTSSLDGFVRPTRPALLASLTLLWAVASGVALVSIRRSDPAPYAFLLAASFVFVVGAVRAFRQADTVSFWLLAEALFLGIWAGADLATLMPSVPAACFATPEPCNASLLRPSLLMLTLAAAASGVRLVLAGLGTRRPHTAAGRFALAAVLATAVVGAEVGTALAEERLAERAHRAYIERGCTAPGVRGWTADALFCGGGHARTLATR